MDDQKLQRLQMLSSFLEEYDNNGIKPEEIRQVLEVLASIIADLKSTYSTLFQNSEQRFSAQFGSVSNRVEETIGEIVRVAEALQNLEQFVSGIPAELKAEVEKVKKLISPKTDLSPLEKKIGEVEKKIPSKSELMTEIEKLRKEVEVAKKTAATAKGSPRRIYQPYREDLSGQCDGNNKAFYLSRAPLQTDTVMVFGTDFPTILRPSIDFTVSNKSVTLTSAVPAPNSGATLICTYFA